MKSKFYVVMHFLLAKLIQLLFNVRVTGRENEPKRSEGPYIAVANHISFADPIFVGLATKHQQPRYMAKAELFKVPLLRLIVKGLGAYPVNRGGADIGAVKRTISMLNEGKTIGIFPQGHRYKRVEPETTPIKNGLGMIAGKTGATILPIYIYTKNNRATLFNRKHIIIGKPITADEYAFQKGESSEYSRVTQLAFDKVCEMGREYRKTLADKKLKKKKAKDKN